MTTSILLPNFDSRYECETMNSRFFPKMKCDSNDYYSFDKENYEINSIYEKKEEINKVNTMSFLFPSIPIKVSYSY